MIGLGSVLLYLMHISQKLGSSCKIFMNSESFIPTFLTGSHRFLLLGWLNYLCTLVAILTFSDLFLVVIFLIKDISSNISQSGRSLVIGMW